MQYAVYAAYTQHRCQKLREKITTGKSNHSPYTQPQCLRLRRGSNFMKFMKYSATSSQCTKQATPRIPRHSPDSAFAEGTSISTTKTNMNKYGPCPPNSRSRSRVKSMTDNPPQPSRNREMATPVLISRRARE